MPKRTDATAIRLHFVDGYRGAGTIIRGQMGVDAGGDQDDPVADVTLTGGAAIVWKSSMPISLIAFM